MISPTQRPVRYNTQHCEETDSHASSRIRTRNTSKITAADLRLRPRGGCDRHVTLMSTLKVRLTVRHTELSVATVRFKWNNCLNFMKPKILFPLVALRSVKQAYQCYTQFCGVVCSTNWEGTGRGLSNHCNKIYQRF